MAGGLLIVVVQKAESVWRFKEHIVLQAEKTPSTQRH
jgi:hypothetical protein